MNLEEQVCSLEPAKRLKELGMKQQSLLYYQNEPYNDGSDDIVIKIKEKKIKNHSNNLINIYEENNRTPKYNELN